jgi:hypothetical protein
VKTSKKNNMKRQNEREKKKRELGIQMYSLSSSHIQYEERRQISQ